MMLSFLFPKISQSSLECTDYYSGKLTISSYHKLLPISAVFLATLDVNIISKI